MSEQYKLTLEDICIDNSDKKNLTNIEVDKKKIAKANCLNNRMSTYVFSIPFYYNRNKYILSTFFKNQKVNFVRYELYYRYPDSPARLLKMDIGNEYIINNMQLIDTIRYPANMDSLANKTNKVYNDIYLTKSKEEDTQIQ